MFRPLGRSWTKQGFFFLCRSRGDRHVGHGFTWKALSAPLPCENAELLHSFLAPRLSQTPKCPSKVSQSLALVNSVSTLLNKGGIACRRPTAFQNFCASDKQHTNSHSGSLEREVQGWSRVAGQTKEVLLFTVLRTLPSSGSANTSPPSWQPKDQVDLVSQASFQVGFMIPLVFAMTEHSQMSHHRVLALELGEPSRHSRHWLNDGRQLLHDVHREVLESAEITKWLSLQSVDLLPKYKTFTTMAAAQAHDTSFATATLCRLEQQINIFCSGQLVPVSVV